jgi:predicted enzyme related to lactoylglutathione lyase
VKNLNAMVAQLKAAGIDVVPDPNNDATNKFARLVDPEGNPIELWQPAE